MAKLDVGDAAPDFTLDSTQGKVTLSKQLADGDVLLVFYPGDDTAVCTKQLCDYAENLSVFSDLGVQVLGINPQDMKSHKKFAKKYELPFPLVSDPSKKACKAYDAIGMFGLAKRALVLVGSDGKVRWMRSDLPIFHRSAAELEELISNLD